MSYITSVKSCFRIMRDDNSARTKWSLPFMGIFRKRLKKLTTKLECFLLEIFFAEKYYFWKILFRILIWRNMPENWTRDQTKNRRSSCWRAYKLFQDNHRSWPPRKYQNNEQRSRGKKQSKFNCWHGVLWKFFHAFSMERSGQQNSDSTLHQRNAHLLPFVQRLILWSVRCHHEEPVDK